MKTTKEERIILEKRVKTLIYEKQKKMINSISDIKEEYRNIRKVNSLNYTTNNLFIELGVGDLTAFYTNAVSDKTAYHKKGYSYYRLLKVLGL